jgi:hypothetical protein
MPAGLPARQRLLRWQGRHFHKNAPTEETMTSRPIRLSALTALTALAAATLALAGPASAASFTYSGNISFHNDVIRVGFSLAQDTTNVRVWTDSFMGGQNFDPITAVWNANTGAFIGDNDDNAGIAPGQTRFDSGLVFASLAAGDYVFTVATFPNDRRGTSLANGFVLDNATPIAMANWCQPSNGCNMGTFFRVNLSGVDSTIPPVQAIPEPETYALMLGGLAALGAVARRRRQQA